MRLLASVLMAGGLTAVEPLDLSDLRLGIGLVDGSACVASGPWRSELGTGTQQRLDAVLGADLGWFGVLGGLGAWRERRSGALAERTAAGGRICAGPYLPCGPIDLQLLPWAGTGRARLETGGGADDGRLRAWGVDAGLVAVVRGAVAGFECGWQEDASDHALGGLPMAYRASGWRTALVLGWRF